MKILQVISQISDFMGDSGQVLLIAKYLQQNNHYVQIVTTDGDPFTKNPEHQKKYHNTRMKLVENRGKIIKINNVPVLPVHCNFNNLGMYSFEAGHIAKKIIKDFDIIHIYSWYHHLGFVFSQVAHKHNIPFFVSMWGTLQPGAHKFHSNKKKILDILFTKKMLSQCTGLHSIGESETKQYIKWGCDPKKIHYIDNGIVLENFQFKNTTKIFEKILFDRKTKYFLYVGRLHEKKGLELLIQSFKRFLSHSKDYHLIIAGGGNQEYVDKLKLLVQSLNLSSYIHFAGFVSEEEKLELFNNAKVFILTSYDDIHPRAVQEALAMGLPVIITDVCDYPEVEKYNTGLIVQLNEKSIYEGMLQIISKNLDILSNNAQKMIKERFLLSDKVKQFEQLYFDSIDKKS